MSDAPASGAHDPGDLSRRVVARRRALGLSVDEVAGRAGTNPGYLRYLERHAGARPTPAACARLAAALETSVEWLRGGGVDLPPGHQSPPAAAPSLSLLERAECLGLIEHGGIGRVVFDDGDVPIALPVNFQVHDGSVVFRTGEGSIARAAQSKGPMSLEVDHLDEALAEGWSVLVTGDPEVVTDRGELEALEAASIQPWAGGDRSLTIRLRPKELSGRRIRRWHDATG